MSRGAPHQATSSRYNRTWSAAVEQDTIKTKRGEFEILSRDRQAPGIIKIILNNLLIRK
jgi:hypothetical protein